MVSAQLYHKMLYAFFIIVFLFYNVILIGLNFKILVLSLMFIYFLINQRFICRIICLKHLNSIAIDVCGCLLPLIASIFTALNGKINFDIFLVFLSLSITTASVNTILSSKSIIVNVIRYSISLFLISLSIFQSYECYFYILPLVTAMGIIIGSDILPYLFMYYKLKYLKKTLVIGGAKALDAISISTSLTMFMAILYIILTKLFNYIGF